MFNLFKKHAFSISAVCSGKLISITDVKDDVFSQKMLGDGYAIIPTEGKIYSPVDGKITTVFPTKHAIGITTSNNLEVLVHLGIDTVNLKGKPFEVLIKEGDKIKKGDYLANMDLNMITSENYDPTIIVVYTNMKIIKSVSEIIANDVKHGKEVQTIEFKK